MNSKQLGDWMLKKGQGQRQGKGKEQALVWLTYGLDRQKKGYIKSRKLLI